SLLAIGGTVVDSIADNSGYVVQLPDTAVFASVDTLLLRMCVEYAEPNYNTLSMLFDAPDDSLFGQEWHLLNTGQNGGTAGADIGAMAGWAFIHNAPDVIVAVLDKGIAITRPDLVDN